MTTWTDQIWSCRPMKRKCNTSTVTCQHNAVSQHGFSFAVPLKSRKCTCLLAKRKKIRQHKEWPFVSVFQIQKNEQSALLPWLPHNRCSMAGLIQSMREVWRCNRSHINYRFGVGNPFLQNWFRVWPTTTAGQGSSVVFARRRA